MILSFAKRRQGLPPRARPFGPWRPAGAAPFSFFSCPRPKSFLLWPSCPCKRLRSPLARVMRWASGQRVVPGAPPGLPPSRPLPESLSVNRARSRAWLWASRTRRPTEVRLVILSREANTVMRSPPPAPTGTVRPERLALSARSSDAPDIGICSLPRHAHPAAAVAAMPYSRIGSWPPISGRLSDIPRPAPRRTP